MSLLSPRSIRENYRTTDRQISVKECVLGIQHWGGKLWSWLASWFGQSMEQDELWVFLSTRPLKLSNKALFSNDLSQDEYPSNSHAPKSSHPLIPLPLRQTSNINQQFDLSEKRRLQNFRVQVLMSLRVVKYILKTRHINKTITWCIVCEIVCNIVLSI